MLSLKSLLLKAKSPPLQASGGDEASGGDVADDSPKKQPQKEEKAPAQPEPHIKALSDDILRLLLKCLPPKETSSLLRSCKSLAKLADDAWKTKLHAMRDDYVIAYKDIKAPSTPAHHHRVELQKRYRRLNCYRPNIERWGEEPYWYANHPCEASPFNAVRRSHDVTDFRLSVRSNRLEKGRYRAYWRVNSTSGFCVLQLDTEVHSERRGGGSTSDHVQHFSSLWNTREDRGKGWTDICAMGGEVVEIGADGGYIKARVWKRELDFTGGILVDCLQIQKLEPVPPLMNSRLLMSSW